MQVRLLGEVELEREGPVALGGPNQRRMLAALAIRRREVVSVSWLVDVLWPEHDPPSRAEHNVRTYVHRLRTALAEDGVRVETVGTGYRLRLDVEELDVAHFECLADIAVRAAETGDPVGALDHIHQAEQLWRGRPLGAFERERWAVPTVVRLLERHANLRERRAAALIELGRTSEAIEVLDALVHEERLRERPRGLLMQALYEAGRQAEALRAFREYRSFLVDEIGVEPSTELVSLDRSIAAGNVPAPAAKPHRRVGAYELHEPIGEGTFAIVHRATQPSFGREVAVKIIRAEFANQPEFIRRFEAEAQLVSRIEHFNVVPLYDYWREPDRAFLTMRWMTGGSLTAAGSTAPWSLDDTVALVDQIAAALEAAHRHGVVHRDVKPENILFDADGRAYLGDFGIALDAGHRSHPDDCAVAGSPIFASPEQLRGEPVGPEADVYALAIVTYAAADGSTRRSPTRPDEATLLHRQLHEPIPSVRDIRPDLPERIDDVLAIATAKRPGRSLPRRRRVRARAPWRASVRPHDRAPTSGRLRGRTRSRVSTPSRRPTPTTSTDAIGSSTSSSQRMADPEFRLLAVVGPSGSGKSSRRPGRAHPGGPTGSACRVRRDGSSPR